jgi:hypothetical protein
MTMDRRLKGPRLTEHFSSRQHLRRIYLVVSKARDCEPDNPELTACNHLLFKSLTVLDTVLDDEASTEVGMMTQIAGVKKPIKGAVTSGELVNGNRKNCYENLSFN